jgi:hypothetical protein
VRNTFVPRPTPAIPWQFLRIKDASVKKPPVGGFVLPAIRTVQIALGRLQFSMCVTAPGRRRRYPATIKVLVIVLVFVSALTALGLPAASVMALMTAAVAAATRLGPRPRES